MMTPWWCLRKKKYYITKNISPCKLFAYHHLSVPPSHIFTIAILYHLESLLNVLQKQSEIIDVIELWHEHFHCHLKSMLNWPLFVKFCFAAHDIGLLTKLQLMDSKNKIFYQLLKVCKPKDIISAILESRGSIGTNGGFLALGLMEHLEMAVKIFKAFGV